MMENSNQKLRKVNTFFEMRPSREDNKMFFEQLDQAPQQALFELSESQAPLPLQLRPVNVDPWYTTQSSNRIDNAAKCVNTMRRTVYIRPSNARKLRPDDFQGVSLQSGNKSNIPKLKNLLEKLESPDKSKKTEDKNQQKPTLIDNYWKQRPSLKLFTQSQHVSVRIINQSNEKKGRRMISHFKEGKTEVLFAKSKPLRVSCKDFEQHMSLIRQARKKRTLKNLLL